MKIKASHLCTIAQICYHLTFLGGAGFYVAEFQKTRDTIVQQVDRVEEEGKKLRKTGTSIKVSIKSVGKELKLVREVCRKLKF